MSKAFWYEHALKDIGLEEIVGEKDNPRIVEMHSYTTLHADDDETSWCSSAMNCWMAECKLPYTGSAAARSWLNWGVKLEEPREGCVVVLSRGTNPAHGHVGFYTGDHGNMIQCYGGNQDNRCRISFFPKSKVLGYRWPEGLK